MRTAAASPLFWCLLATISCAIHCVWAFQTRSGVPIQRLGASLIIFGIMTAARPIIRIGYKKWRHQFTHEDWNSSDDEDRMEWLDSISSQIIGPVLLFVGTLLSGYGDLLGEVIISSLQ